MLECQCEIPHVSIRATHPISKGSEIIVAGATREHALGYLLQFDGSFKPGTEVGGAGFSIFRVLPGQVQFVVGRCIALAQCADNLEAEAMAFETGSYFEKFSETLIIQI